MSTVTELPLTNIPPCVFHRYNVVVFQITADSEIDNIDKGFINEEQGIMRCEYAILQLLVELYILGIKIM